MKFNKKRFMESELGANLENLIKTWDWALDASSLTEIEREIICNRYQAQWEVYKVMFRQFYGIDYAFTRTDKHFGVVNEDDYNDWLIKIADKKEPAIGALTISLTASEADQ